MLTPIFAFLKFSDEEKPEVKRLEEDAARCTVSPGPQQKDLHPHLSKFVKTLPSFLYNNAAGEDTAQILYYNV